MCKYFRTNSFKRSQKIYLARLFSEHNLQMVKLWNLNKPKAQNSCLLPRSSLKRLTKIQFRKRYKNTKILVLFLLERHQNDEQIK
jgi:hypothetical protein